MTGAEAPSLADDKRRIHRVAVRLLVSQGGGSRPLGETRDLSLDGFFVDTERPLPVGSQLTLLLSLDARTEIAVGAEVMRTVPGGMGLQFRSLSPKARRRLRRFVVAVNSVDGTRRTARALLDGEADGGEPLEGAAVRALLLAASGCAMAVVPEGRPVQVDGTMAVDDDALRLHTTNGAELRMGEPVVGLLTHDFVSWSFDTRVLEVNADSARLALPQQLLCSERRSTDRQIIAGSTRLALPRPWRPEEVLQFAVLERSAGGFSFRADPASCQLAPGAALEGARLEGVSGGLERLESAVVKHITLVEPPGRAPWLKVGVSHGVRRTAPPVVRARDAARRPWLLESLAGGWQKLAALTGLLWHRARRRAQGEEQASFEVVRFHNARGLEVVGLLNRAFPDEVVPEVPLVLIVPGFGGRKETLSALAGTLIDNFRRHHQDVAVLRIDCTDNLGESECSPGNAAEGRRNLKFTTSGQVADITAALAWARTNGTLKPSKIVLITSSFASIAGRVALCRPECADISLWVSYMGAADAQDSILQVAGHVDIVGNHRRGIPNGVITLAGCMVDGDHFCRDLDELGAGSLEDARRDMASIRQDILWISGRHDAYMDRRRIDDVLSVSAPGGRELLEFDSGHLPRSGTAALEQFACLAENIHHHLHGRRIQGRLPALGWLAANAEEEWTRVRRRDVSDRRDYWHDYLLAGGELGFDVLMHAEAYRELMALHAGWLDGAGQRVLELGAGTGNLMTWLAQAPPARLVSADLVPEALAVAEQKASELGLVLETVRADLEGTPRLALRRWLRGELAGLDELGRRIPGVHRAFMERLASHYGPELHALLRGTEGDAIAIGRAAGLGNTDAELLAEIALLTRVEAGRRPEADARAGLRHLPASLLDRPGGLPWDEASFDRVSASLLLSYLRHPDDLLSEAFRVLRPGGLLVASTLRRDADLSTVYLDLVRTLEDCAEDELPAGLGREQLLAATRAMADQAAELMRREEEGQFVFWSAAGFERLLQQAGFVDVELCSSFGDPGQVVLARGHKPGSGG